MLTIAIPQLYCGASGKKGAYNRQEVGLARAFAALGCRAVVLYPDPDAAAVSVEQPETNVTIYTCPARRLGVHAFFKSWQPLLEEGVQAVHVMGDNSLGVPGLYRFCRNNGIFFYSQLGALRSASDHAAVRAVMDLAARPNYAIYKKTPAYAKTPTLAAEMQAMGIPCAGVLPVGLDTAVIPPVPADRAHCRAALGLDPDANYLLFVGRLDPYKRPLDLAPLLQALPDWRAVIIGQGALADELDRRLPAGRAVRIPRLDTTAVHAYYHACNVFVNLNDQEIFGMSLLEAMYAGCPPVARHAPGPDLIIEDGVSGVLGDTIEDLAAGVRRADEAMGMAAQKRINEHFLWQNSAETALELLQRQGVYHG